MLSPTHDHTVNRWRGACAAAAVLREAVALLALARSRAPGAGQALVVWQSALRARWQGLRQWPAATVRVLSRVERRARPAGLGFGAGHALQQAPWHLPPELAELPLAALPPHPAIDGAWLAAQDPDLVRQSALTVLAQLCDAQAVPVRWRGLRLWPRAGAVGERHAWLAPQQAPEPQPAAGPAKAPVAVCLHLYYLSLWPMLWRQLQHIPQPWDLYLSVPAFAASAQLARIAQDHPRTTFWPLPNRGRDVAPLLRWLQDGAFDGHDLVCKLHGKHSPHRADGAAWRDSLLDGLLGSTERVAAIVERFRQDPQLGLLAPAGALQRPTAAPGWAKNARGVAQLARRLGLDEIPADTLFAAGTMFWFRPQALQRLRCLGSDPALFPPEMHQTDGTPAHALERLMGACAQADGFAVAAWPPPALTGPG